MFRLHIHDHAEADLEAIHERDPASAHFLVALLQELESDQSLLEHLLDHGHRGSAEDWAANFDVSKWWTVWKTGRDLWRLKTWEVEAQARSYRIVYAYYPRLRTFLILGVFHRSEFNYEPDSAPARRVLADYEDF